ncbi:MAG: glycosyltransferase family 39 protein [Candidatus Aminicenantales bacterium]|jgi:4-amino-4-deoxy-L-arabinose transferase-like glycosyltransferase
MAEIAVRSRFSALPLVAFVVLATVLGFYNLTGDLMNDDEGSYLYSAWRVGAGDAPYADFNLVQAPLSFWLMGGVFKIVGPSVGVARGLSYLLVLGAALFIYACAGRALGLSSWASAAAAGVFLFSKHVFYLGRAFMPDDLMLFCGAAALYIFLRADAGPNRRLFFLAGALSGLAALAKLNGALVFAGFILYLMGAGLARRALFRDRLDNGLWTAAGFMLSFGLPFAALLLLVPGAAYQTVLFHAGKHAAEGSILSRPFVRFVQFVGNHNYGLVSAGLVGGFLGPAMKNKKGALLGVSAVLPLVFLFLPGRFFIRYAVFALVPLALFCAAGLEELGRPGRTRRVLLPAALVLIALGLAPTFAPARLASYDRGTRALAAYVRDHTKSGAFVFGDDPFINFLARRPCPGRLADVSESWTKAGLITSADIRRECEAAPTALIFVEKGHSAHHLVSLTDFPKFQAYLDEKFRLDGVMKREFLDVEVYLRKSP